MAGNVWVSSQKMTPGETSSQTLPTSSVEHDSLVPLHPLRIRPAGNAYTATEDIKLAAGSFAALPDEILIQVLESLDAASLKRLGCACKALYAFSRLEELWKTLCIEYEIPISGFLDFLEFSGIVATRAILNFVVGTFVAVAVVWPI